jgi:hypothetical protein
MRKPAASPLKSKPSRKTIEACRTHLDALFSLQFLMCTHMKQPDLIACDLEQMEIQLRALNSELGLNNEAIDPSLAEASVQNGSVSP